MNQFVTRGLVPALSLVLAVIAMAADTAPAASPQAAAPKTDSFPPSEAEFAHVKAGMVDGFHNKPAAAAAEASLPQIQALQRSRMQVVSAHEKEAGQAYLNKAESAPGATKTGSGLLYIPVSAGTGPSPARSDRVTVNY